MYQHVKHVKNHGIWNSCLINGLLNKNQPLSQTCYCWLKKPWNFPSEMAAFKTPKSQKSQKSERRRPL
jgi:hypothetical protein